MNMPKNIENKLDQMTKELRKIYKLAEQSWGDDADCELKDKNFYMHGFQAGYSTKKLDQISDEEINKASWKYEPRDKFDASFIREAFIKGCEWYREELKQK